MTQSSASAVDSPLSMSVQELAPIVMTASR